MARDIEAVHALCRKMAEEKEPEKLELLKQQLRLLFLQSDADSEEETPRGDPRKRYLDGVLSVIAFHTH
jgi:hypothetical protein